jgi:N-acetylglucosaminyldiphosphoundecaprenol N-acetyl-beta-D-mannosaminyltransferase
LYGLKQQRVYGPELMRRALVESGPSVGHFLYGSSEATLQRLEARIAEFAPQARIRGSISPPFRPLIEAEISAHADMILSSGATIVWVGLGLPKQELWMDRVAAKLPGFTLVGVGAAFDLLAGTVRQAPGWMQRSGLEWLFRLIQEPRRLWRRYIWNNPAFLGLFGIQMLTRHPSRKTTA